MPMFNTVEEALYYIENKRIKGSFDNFVNILHKYDLTLNKQIIHVAGTNGKGSTVVYIRDILMKHGYTVGTFTSPYIICHNDRICVNGNYIPDDILLSLINQDYNMIEQEKLSMFEIDIILMIQYFNILDLDYVVIETGIGGLTDKTNFVKSKVSAVVSIGYDHMLSLGNTLEEIAYQKAGIIKENQNFFTAESNESVLEVFKQVCKEKHSVFHQVSVNEDYHYHGALYQKKNASLAIAVCSSLLTLDPVKVQEVIDEFFIPARYEQIGNVIIDGAHNTSAIDSLLENIKNIKGKSIGIIFSALADKAVDAMTQQLSVYPMEMVAFSDDRFVDTGLRNYQDALNEYKCKYDIVVVTGSLHFVSTVRKYLTSNSG